MIDFIYNFFDKYLLPFFCLVSALLLFLSLSVLIRYRAERRTRRELDYQFPGTAFDVSTIAPQIRNVRNNYIATAHCRSTRAYHKAGLLAAARRFVTSLSYFHPEAHDQQEERPHCG